MWNYPFLRAHWQQFSRFRTRVLPSPTTVENSICYGNIDLPRAAWSITETRAALSWEYWSITHWHSKALIVLTAHQLIQRLRRRSAVWVDRHTGICTSVKSEPLGQLEHLSSEVWGAGKDSNASSTRNSPHLATWNLQFLVRLVFADHWVWSSWQLLPGAFFFKK